MLALRPDYLPLPYAQALQRLHTHALPFDGQLAAATVKTELRAPLSRVFAEFEPEPFASASLPQVHRARRARSRATSSATSGRCTFTATGRPSRSRARAGGCASSSPTACSTPTRSRAISCCRPDTGCAFIDFGMFGRLDRAQRRRMGLMLLALISGDYRAVGTALLRMSILRPDADPRGFRDAVAELVEDWYEAETGMTAAQLPQLLLALLPTPSNLWGAWKEQRIDFLGAALELPGLVLELADTLRRRDVLDQLTTSVTVTSARDWLPALAGVATGGLILRGLRALTR